MNLVSAQKVQIERLTKENEKLRTNIQAIKYLKDLNGDIYAITYSQNLLLSGEILIQKFDGENFAFLKEQIIEDIEKGVYTLNDATISGNKIILQISVFKVLEATSILYHQEIDISTLKVSKTQQIASFPNPKGVDLTKTVFKHREQELIWTDSSNQNIVFILPDLNKEYASFRIILQALGKIEYEGEIKLPSMEHGMRVAHLFLDTKTNNIYSIIQANSDKNKTEQHNYIIIYNKFKNALSYSKINNGLNRLAITNIQKDSRSNRIKVTGFYAEKGEEKKDKDILRGMFCVYVDDYENIKFMPSKDVDSKTSDLAAFELKQTYNLENGETIYVNEKKIEFARWNQQRKENDYFIQWEDIIIYKTNSKDSLIWATYIPKKQFFTALEYRFGSMTSSFKDNKIYIYTASTNDFDGDNHYKIVIDQGRNLKKAKLIEVILEAKNGSVSSNILLEGQTAKELGFFFLPYFAARLDNNEIIMPCLQKNKRHSLIRIFLNQ